MPVQTRGQTPTNGSADDGLLWRRRFHTARVHATPQAIPGLELSQHITHKTVEHALIAPPRHYQHQQLNGRFWGGWCTDKRVGARLKDWNRQRRLCLREVKQGMATVMPLSLAVFLRKSTSSIVFRSSSFVSRVASCLEGLPKREEENR